MQWKAQQKSSPKIESNWQPTFLLHL
ncbi:rCG49884 [Rattus norvegicus]|uniref:RCG49884 n=1 Tax=Rattus norvegicus TaxID=10116 RepID=A6K4D8_RAT|nr:rCG49884 [Rattus norvegicus]